MHCHHQSLSRYRFYRSSQQRHSNNFRMTMILVWMVHRMMVQRRDPTQFKHNVNNRQSLWWQLDKSNRNLELHYRNISLIPCSRRNSLNFDLYTTLSYLKSVFSIWWKVLYSLWLCLFNTSDILELDWSISSVDSFVVWRKIWRCSCKRG